jgi:hypothetical protein
MFSRSTAPITPCRYPAHSPLRPPYWGQVATAIEEFLDEQVWSG